MTHLARAMLGPLLATLMALGACGDDGGGSGCEEGERRGCVGSSGDCVGTQSCGPNGTFGTCVCQTDPGGDGDGLQDPMDAGRTDGGEMDAAAGGMDAGSDNDAATTSPDAATPEDDAG